MYKGVLCCADHLGLYLFEWFVVQDDVNGFVWRHLCLLFSVNFGFLSQKNVNLVIYLQFPVLLDIEMQFFFKRKTLFLSLLDVLQMKIVDVRDFFFFLKFYFEQSVLTEKTLVSIDVKKFPLPLHQTVFILFLFTNQTPLHLLLSFGIRKDALAHTSISIRRNQKRI